ncbi:MAG: ATP-binding protein [Deltaproteobacteria bacterium]|nr:ATP-binding protein [Deltaproteobacteria bacterium]
MSQPLRHIIAAIVGSVLILGGALGYITYRNFHREAELAEKLMFDKGITIIRSAESGFRCNMATASCMEDPGCRRSLQEMVADLARENDLDFLVVFDATGKVLAHNDSSMVGKEILALAAYWARLGNPDSMGPDTFVVGSIFNPSIRNQNIAAADNNPKTKGFFKPDYLILVGLKRAWLNEAHRIDLHYALVQGGILLLLGLAGFVFIFIIQSYYLVNRTLAGMTTLTQNIIESMPNMLVAFDGSGKVIEANSAAKQLLGVTQGQVIGDDFHDFLGASAGPLLRRIRDGQVVLDQELLLKGETAIPVALTGAPLTWEGGAGAVLILRDLRELKAMEKKVKRAERLAALGRLSASVAHEIRNPLSSIKGFIQYFKKKFPSGSKEQAYTETMVAEVNRLNSVITNLLEFTRAKEPNFQNCDLAEVVHHALRLVRSDAQSRGVKIIERVPEQPLLAKVDGDQLIQVFLNLFLNGLEAMPEGGTLRVGIETGRDGNFQIEIADTGSGVREEDLPQLFEPFFTTKSRGTGLGLAVAIQIVENHRGTIGVTSRPGEGTSFRVSLPADGSFSANNSGALP